VPGTRFVSTSEWFVIDLIPYQNDGEGCTMIARKVEKGVNEYARTRINMRTVGILISACD
jgi:hypothetical protein